MIVVNRRSLQKFLEEVTLAGSYEINIEGVKVSPLAPRVVTIDYIEDYELDRILSWAWLFEKESDSSEPEIVFFQVLKDISFEDAVSICLQAALGADNVLKRTDVINLIKDYPGIPDYQFSIPIERLLVLVRFVQRADI